VYTVNLISKDLLLKFMIQEIKSYCLVCVWKYNRNLNMGQIKQVEWLKYFIAPTVNFLALVITKKVHLKFIFMSDSHLSTGKYPTSLCITSTND